MKKLSRVLILLVVAALMSTAFGVSAQGGKGGRLIVNDPNSNTSLDPFVTAWHSWPHYAIFSTLFARGADLSYGGFLADTWEASPDGLTLTIHLIKNATFTDGTPVDARAIKYNLDKYANKDTGSAQGADLIGLLTSTDVIDDYTVKLNLATPYAPLIFTLSGLEIVSPTAYEKEGKDNFGLHPVGAGPFELEELNTNNYILLKKNPDFKWAPKNQTSNPGPVLLDELQITFLGENQTVLSAFETGELTVADIPTTNLADVEANTDVTVNKGKLAEIRYVGFNTSKAPWDNVELRQAFAYATDRDEVNQLGYDGLSEPLYQPLPTTIWGHNPDLDAKSYHFDADKAKAMLDELGYKDVDGDGLREDPTGAKWVVPLAVQNSDEYTNLAQIIDAQWRAVGIPVRIDTMERSALVDLTTTAKHDLFLLNYGYQDPSILTYFFDPSRKGGSNRAWFSTDDLTALLKKADTDLNPDTRYQTITQLSQYVIDQSPWIFLVTPPALTGVRNELHDWKINPDLSFLYWDAYFDK
jgi:peptide/nickel transport system substrate-binding protein